MTKLMRFSRTGAWLTAFTIIVLSAVPGKMRPHVLGNDYFEHFLAYFATGSLLAIGYQRPMQLLSSGVLLATCAGLLECIQLWIPGRTASVGGFTTAGRTKQHIGLSNLARLDTVPTFNYLIRFVFLGQGVNGTLTVLSGRLR